MNQFFFHTSVCRSFVRCRRKAMHVPLSLVGTKEKTNTPNPKNTHKRKKKEGRSTKSTAKNKMKNKHKVSIGKKFTNNKHLRSLTSNVFIERRRWTTQWKHCCVVLTAHFTCTTKGRLRHLDCQLH